MEKHFKLIPNDWDKIICVLFLLVLLSVKIDLISKKKRSKKNLVGAFGSSSGKVIFTLMTKIIIFYIKFTIIHVQKSGLKVSVSRLFKSS